METIRANSNRPARLLLVLWTGTALAATAAASDATSFAEPDGWAVGDALSTYQEWDIFLFSLGNPPDVDYETNPLLADAPNASALPPGFLSSSNNFYAFAGDFVVEAEIFNHGTEAPVEFGTIVWVQTAATQNPDFEQGIALDSVRLVQVDDTPIPGGANGELCQTELLFSGIIGSPFGDVIQDEWLFVFWLPEYTGDFKVVMECYVHSSFRALRVDTLNAATPLCQPLDIDCNCRVETGDALHLMIHLAGPDIDTPPPGGEPDQFDRADLDDDGDVDLGDYAVFQISFPY